MGRGIAVALVTLISRASVAGDIAGQKIVELAHAIIDTTAW